MTFNSQIEAFESLSPRRLYGLLKLRSDIFVVEQNCIFSDMDNADFQSQHFTLTNDADEVIATARIFAPQAYYPEASIGRIVLHPDFRGQGLAQRMMHECIAYCRQHFPESPIRLWAQAHLDSFYSAFGFVKEGKVGYEDGILHQTMILPVA